jgi:hypothetical protein
LVDFHCDFAVGNPALITVQFRDLIHARPSDQSRVRRLQSQYVGVWVDALCHEIPDLDRDLAGTAVRAVFGLINSTPYSSKVSPKRMHSILRTMATGALAGAIRPGSRGGLGAHDRHE